MGGKDCQCTAEADKVTNPTRYDFAVLLRIIIFTALVLTFVNAICYFTCFNYYYSTHILTFTNIIIVLFIVTSTRTLFVGTCCLPDLQLSSHEIQKIISERDIAAHTRILQKQSHYAQTLSKGLQIPTISYDPHDTDNKIDYSQLKKLIQFIQDSYPKVHQHLTRTIINDHSLVFRWESKSQIGKTLNLKPYCLTAHMDVVPAPEPEKWVHPPFSGHIDNENIWGRGAIDDKQNVFAILEAIEDILTHDPNFTPIRDIYLAFGQDEEIGGFQGAQHIAKHFFDTLGPNCFEFVADEGLFIIDGMVPGHKKPIAFVCVAEKGSVTVQLSVDIEPGHASAPPHDSAIGILATAVKAVENNPFPAHFDGPAETLFTQLRSGFSGPLKFIMTNLWLFAPIVKKILASNPMTSTMVRTTSALTIFKAGQKVNLLPSSASACINHRIHPLDSVQKVLDWDTKVINDPRVKVSALEPLEPAPVTSSTTPAFKHISHAIYQTFDDICSVVPGVFVANSDSKHYWALTDQIYRFNPILLNKDEVKMFHGFNEKIGIEAYAKLIIFWRTIVMMNNNPNTAVNDKAKSE